LLSNSSGNTLYKKVLYSVFLVCNTSNDDTVLYSAVDLPRSIVKHNYYTTDISCRIREKPWCRTCPSSCCHHYITIRIKITRFNTSRCRCIFVPSKLTRICAFSVTPILAVLQRIRASQSDQKLQHATNHVRYIVPRFCHLLLYRSRWTHYLPL
jgi:hypothetical protein